MSNKPTYEKLEAKVKVLEARIAEFESLSETAPWQLETSLLDFMEDVINVIDRNFNVIWANKASVQKFGDYLGKKCYQIYKGSNEPCPECLVQDVFVHGKVKSTEEHWLSADGVSVYCIVTAVPFRDRSGNINYVVESSKDITERKRMEWNLIQVKKEWESTFDAVTDHIYIRAPDYTVLKANKAVFDTYRLNPEDVIGEKCYKVFYNREKPCEGCEVAEALETKRPTFREKKVPLWGVNSHHYCYPILNDEGDVVAIVDYSKDVTHLKSLEEQIIRSEKMAALGQMASGIAHDFNNALATIMAQIDLLALQEDDPQKIEGLKVIEIASKDAAEMVRRLQEFARVRTRKDIVSNVDINMVIKESINLTKPIWRDQAQGKGITIKVKKDLHDIPHILGNCSEMREVLTNLIFNAVDAMPTGGTLYLKSGVSEDRKFVNVIVSDTGIGMSKGIKTKIFDPFFTTKGVSSTGMGLGVSYRITERHGGDIGVESIEGKGSTFTIKLPVSKEVREEAKREVLTKKVKKSEILLIEDEDQLRKVLGEMLEVLGHKVTQASSGKEGLKIFEREKFDMVFTDLGMPELSGWYVASRVKQIDSHMPVVMITGWGDQFSKETLSRSGVDIIVSKPFRINRVREVLAEAIELKRKGSTTKSS